MSSTEENMTVRFSVKELFARIDSKLDAIGAILEAKADHAALLALEERVADLEKKSSETDLVADALLKEKTSRYTARQKLIGVLASIVVIVPPLAYTIDRIQSILG